MRRNRALFVHLPVSRKPLSRPIVKLCAGSHDAEFHGYQQDDQANVAAFTGRAPSANSSGKRGPSGMQICILRFAGKWEKPDWVRRAGGILKGSAEIPRSGLGRSQEPKYSVTGGTLFPSLKACRPSHCPVVEEAWLPRGHPILELQGFRKIVGFCNLPDHCLRLALKPIPVQHDLLRRRTITGTAEIPCSYVEALPK